MTIERDQDTFVSRRSIFTAAAAALAGTALAAAPLSAMAEANPDTELLRLDREHDLAFARANERHLDDDECMKRCEVYTDLEFAIQDIPAQTWAGVAVKARIAIEYAERCSEGRILDDMLPSLIDDVLRLAHVTGKQSTVWPHAEKA